MRASPMLLVLACSAHAPGGAPGRGLFAPPPPAAAATPATADAGTDAAVAACAAANAPPGSVCVAITGVVASAPGQPRESLEICPAAYLRPCSGVQLVGELAPAFVSTPGRVKVVRLWGHYDGARLYLDGRAELRPRPPSDAEYRNPCPEYQDELPGEPNASTPLEGLASYIVRQHPQRHAATHWDAPRQTLTVQLTGDVSALRAEVKATRSDRLCLIGGARHSLDDLRRLRNAVMAIAGRRNAGLVAVDMDMLTNSLAIRIENADHALLAEIRNAAGPEARITSFIERLDGSLDGIPRPPDRGDIPIVTTQRRWDEGPWYGVLGHFVIRLDAKARCVYLETRDGERELPIWPQGFAAYADPFRVVDFDDRPIPQTPQPQLFGGASIPITDLASPPANACGAKNAWLVTPDR